MHVGVLPQLRLCGRRGWRVGPYSGEIAGWATSVLLISRPTFLLCFLGVGKIRSRLLLRYPIDHYWIRDVSDAITVPVLMQYLELHHRLQHVSVQPGVPDRFVWRWCSSGTYSSASAYRALFLGRAKELWHSKAPNNVHFFVWLVIHGRC
jgi:hypothetical protein